jgi:hypothetical protein
MQLVKEIGFPLSPVLFEALIRFLLMPGQAWHWYFSAGSIIITFAVWCMVGSLRNPSRPLIRTDQEVTRGLGELKIYLSLVAMFGLLFYGSYVTALTVAAMYPDSLSVITLVQGVFASISLVYAAFCIILIWWNRDFVGAALGD